MMASFMGVSLTAKTVVLKFGGAALKDLESFDNVASLICTQAQKYERVCVVVSAMKGMTDYLVSLADSVYMGAPKREKDMLVSVGERMSMALLAMKLAEKGIEAVSLTGSQAGIITTSEHEEAKVIDVRPHRLEKLFGQAKLPVIAGFQGMSVDCEITTLGRGGSDTSAVALAVALGAEKVIFYKDVPGIYERDPKSCDKAQFFKEISYQKALEVIGEGGSAVLHPRCVELASKNNLTLQVRSFLEVGEGTFVGYSGERGQTAHRNYEIVKNL